MIICVERWYVVECTLGAQRGGPYDTRGQAEDARKALAKKDPAEGPNLKLERRETREESKPAHPFYHPYGSIFG